MKPDAVSAPNSVKKLLWRAALVPLILSVAAAIGLAWIVGQLLDQARWVDHTDQVIAQARTCKELALSTAGVLTLRLATGASNYTAAYERDLAQMQSQLDRLQTAIADNPQQSTRLQALRVDFDNWKRTADAAFSGTPTGDWGARAQSIQGRLESFLKGFDDFINAEELLRQQRALTLEQADRSIRAGRTVLLLGIGGVISLFLWRELNRIARLFQISESAARERAELLQTTLASIADGVISTDTKGQVNLVNPAAERLIGWTSTEAKGKSLGTVFEIFNQQTGETVEDPVSKVLKEGKTVGLANHTVLRSRSGKELPIADSAAPIRDDTGVLDGVVLVFRDCSEERRVGLLRQHLAAIVESSDDAIVSKDLNGIITAWNLGAERMFGYQPEEVIGRSITLLIPPDRQDEEVRILSALRRGERVDHFETVRVRKDGKLLNVSETISPVRDEEGKLVGASKIARDITRQKADEAELRQTRDQLKVRVAERTRELSQANERLFSANKQLEGFAYTIAHDLRAPLRAIQGLATMLQEEYAGAIPEDGKLLCTRLIGNAELMDRLIEDLLNYSRVATSELVLTRVELESAVSRATALLSRTLEETSARLDIKPPLPAVVAHEQTLVHVISNLVSNAVKFVSPGTQPHVTIFASQRDGVVRLTIQDNGIGIAPDYHERIFEIFERLHDVNTYPGTGVGLAVVRKGIERMGGKLGLESSPGVGSRFWFELKSATLPAATKQTQTPPNNSAQPEPPPPS